MANAYINSYQELSPSDLLYINTKKQLQADTITANTAQFTGASILEPTLQKLGSTTKFSFEYYINGQNVSPLLVDSLTTGGGNVIFTFNTSQLGYSLETDDEIIVIGKFA